MSGGTGVMKDATSGEQARNPPRQPLPRLNS